jgi:hypothetical protein
MWYKYIAFVSDDLFFVILKEENLVLKSGKYISDPNWD